MCFSRFFVDINFSCLIMDPLYQVYVKNPKQTINSYKGNNRLVRGKKKKIDKNEVLVILTKFSCT